MTTPVPLKDSRLYALNQADDLLSSYVPDMAHQMAVEYRLNEQYPRAEDNTNGRVFIHYLMANGRDMVFVVEDPERWDRKIDIDHIVETYTTALGMSEHEINPKVQISMASLSLMNTALELILGTQRDTTGGRAKATSANIFLSLITVFFDGSDDVVVLVRDKVSEDRSITSLDIYQLWSMSKA